MKDRLAQLLVLLIFLGPAIIAGCQDDEAYGRAKGDTVKQNARMVTVEHEGHKFIHTTIDYSYHALSTVHHPDCGCFASKK